jgi:hypothetical protein
MMHKRYSKRVDVVEHSLFSVQCTVLGTLPVASAEIDADYAGL